MNRIKKAQTRKKRRKRLLLAVPAAAVLTVLLVLIFSSSPEEDFQMFADSQYENELYVCCDMKLKPSYSYNEGFSTAVACDKKADKKLKKFAEEKIKSLEKKERANAKGTGEHALLSMWTVKDSSNGAKTLLIYSASFEGSSYTRMERTGDYVKTYFFNNRNGLKIKPLQILDECYKAECSDMVQNAIAREYSKKALCDNWQSKVSGSDSSLDNFTLDNDNLTFYIPAGKDGTVLPVPLPLSSLKNSVRTSVLKRYIEKGDRMVAITFDDGPGGKSEKHILDSLEKYDSVATFFYLGRQIKGNEDNVRRASELDCEIGSHAWSHSDLKKLSSKDIKKELSRTSRTIKKITGNNPTVFRPPYGSYSDVVTKAAMKYKLPVVLWSVDSLDWESKDKDKVFKKITETEDLDGRIILCHSIYDSTADAIEELLPWLNEHGYQTVTVSELVKYKTGKKPGYDRIY